MMEDTAFGHMREGLSRALNVKLRAVVHQALAAFFRGEMGVDSKQSATSASTAWASSCRALR
jgi:hypothetical protein